MRDIFKKVLGLLVLVGCRAMLLTVNGPQTCLNYEVTAVPEIIVFAFYSDSTVNMNVYSVDGELILKIDTSVAYEPTTEISFEKVGLGRICFVQKETGREAEVHLDLYDEEHIEGYVGNEDINKLLKRTNAMLSEMAMMSVAYQTVSEQIHTRTNKLHQAAGSTFLYTIKILAMFAVLAIQIFAVKIIFT